MNLHCTRDSGPDCSWPMAEVPLNYQMYWHENQEDEPMSGHSTLAQTTVPADPTSSACQIVDTTTNEVATLGCDQKAGVICYSTDSSKC